MATGLFDDLIPRAAPVDPAGAFNSLIPQGRPAPQVPSYPTEAQIQLAREQQALDEERASLTPGKAALQLGLGAGEAGKGVLRQAIGGVLTALPYTGFLDLIPGYRRGRQEFGRAVSELGTENVAEATELGEGLGGGAAGRVIRDLGTTFTASAPAIPAGLLGGLPLAALTAAGIQGGASFNQYKQYYQGKGLSEPEAEQRALLPSMIGGAITGTLTRIIPGGTEMLLSKFASGELTRGGISGLIKMAVKEVAQEIPEEGLDQIGQGVTEKLLVNPDKPIGDIVDETLFAMFAAGALAGTTAGGLTTIGKTAQAVARPIERGRTLRRLQAYRESPERQRELERAGERVEREDITSQIMAEGQRRTRRIGEPRYDTQTQGEILGPQSQGETIGRPIPEQEAGSQASPPSGVLQTPPAQEVASVPLMITRQMEQDLLARGFSQADINAMTPQQAQSALAAEEPVLPLRPGTKGTDWEDQRGRPVRLVPAPERGPGMQKWAIVPEPSTTGVPNAPTQTQEEAEVPLQPLPKVAPVQFLQVQEGMPELVWYKLTGDITDPLGNVYPAGRNISNGELRRFGYTIPESELAKSAPAPVTDIQVIGQVTPEQQPLLDQVLAKIREENANAPGLPIRRVELIKAPAGVGIVSTQPGRAVFDTVALDLDQLAASGVDRNLYLAAAINEEIIHNAGGRALQEEWSRSDQSIPFNDYWSGRMDVIAGEMTPAQHSRVREVYGRDLNDRVAAAEFVRMLVQERMRGQITEETLGRNTIQYLKQILRRLLDALRTATGTARQNLQQHVNAIEDILRGQQQIRTVEEQQQVGLTDDEITRLGAASPSLPTLRWNPDQSQAGFGLMGVAALNNPAAEPLKMAGRINPQQLINRLRTILPPDEWAWYQNAGIERLAQNPQATAQDFINFMQQNGPKVEVKELSAFSSSTSKARQDLENLAHQLDTIHPQWRDMNQEGIDRLGQTAHDLYFTWRALRDSIDEQIDRGTDSATARYTIVNPKPLDQMPGAVDILVRVPSRSQENVTRSATPSGFSPRTVDRDRVSGILFRGNHFGQSDTNVLGWVRGYMETLPNGRKTFHIFEVQSDWGQRLREAEQSGGTTQEIRNRRGYPNNIQGHPLLRDYNRLALKAAIKHAIDNGADSITISDAETAMLTEGHDRAAQRTLEIPATPSNIALAQHKLALARNNPERGQLFDNELQTLAFGTPIRVAGTQAQRVGEARNEGWEYKELINAPQEPGMRLNYDQVLPRIARELTGMEGAPVNLGEHQNALKRESDQFFVQLPNGMQRGPYDSRAEAVTEANRSGGTLVPQFGQREDLIFRNPDGTPKTSITGRTFDLTATKQRLNQTGGVFPLFGSGKFVSESPFDRMRRESGAQPPPELTPEQQRAREINERIRGRRPETLSAASPKTQEEMDRALAVKEAEEESWVKHRALGVDDWVLARNEWTDEEKLRSRKQAEETFTNAGIPHTWNEQNRYFDIQPGATVESQYRLLDLVKEAMRRQNWPAEPEVAALIASITANSKLGQIDYFDSYVRRQLYKLTRSEASHRGALLGALSHFAKDIREVSLRVEEILERTWADAYGGPAVEKVAEDLAKLVAQMAKAKEVADRILAKAPELTQAGVDAGLIGQIFQMPFFTQAELKERFIAAVIKKTRVTPAEATKLWDVFKEKFDPIRRELGRLALAEVKSLLRPDQRQLIKKPIWQKIQSMVDAGEFDAGHILKIIAGEHGWRTPTQEEISKLRQLARRERELRELNDKERAEVEKFSPNNPEALEKARLEKEKKTEQHRNQILKEMDTRWARFTRPISLNPFKWFGLRHNTASAGLELIAANLLATIGFPFRLSISIASQILPHMTLTPIAYSWQQHQGTLDTLEGQKNFIRDAYLGLEDSISAYLKSVKPAAYAARAAFLGRGEQRNVLRLTSSIAAFDRIRLMAQEEFEKGNVAKAWALKTLGFLDIGFRAARALDAFQTLPAETAEMYHQIRLEMGSQGKSLTEIKNNQYTIMDRIFREWMQAIADTKKGLADAGVTDATEAQVKEIAGTLIRQRQYQKANELGLSGDDWMRQNRLLKSTLAWNEAETKGAGGVVGGALKRIQRGVSKGLGIPTDIGVFSNAIATAINRQLHFTPFYHLLGGGRGEGSPWFATEIDRKRRALDALAGTGFGSIVIAMVLMGIIKVQLPRRMDDDEKEKFIAEGHRFGTVEFQYGDTFVPVSINNSPLWIVAPYLAGAGAFMDLQERRQKEQEKLNAEAAKKGLPPGKIRPMDPGDMAGVAGQAAWQTIFGSRTFSGFLGSIASYGEKLNTRRIVAGRIAPMVPGLPAVREVVSRMGGVTLNNQLATVWDYMLPLPSSQAAMVNKLGDPVRTPSDIQRVVQVLSGGNYGPVAKQETQAYQTLYGSEFKPPTISPNKGYQFPDSFRPMNDKELSRYSILRGQYFQEGLAGIAPGDEAAVKSAYQQAERRALTEVGVQVPAATTTRGTTTTRRATIRGPRRLRSVSRLRRPRLRRLSYRRPRLTSARPRLRRIRRLAA